MSMSRKRRTVASAREIDALRAPIVFQVRATGTAVIDEERSHPQLLKVLNGEHGRTEDWIVACGERWHRPGTFTDVCPQGAYVYGLVGRTEVMPAANAAFDHAVVGHLLYFGKAAMAKTGLPLQELGKRNLGQDALIDYVRHPAYYIVMYRHVLPKTNDAVMQYLAGRDPTNLLWMRRLPGQATTPSRLRPRERLDIQRQLLPIWETDCTSPQSKQVAVREEARVLERVYLPLNKINNASRGDPECVFEMAKVPWSQTGEWTRRPDVDQWRERVMDKLRGLLELVGAEERRSKLLLVEHTVDVLDRRVSRH